MRITPPPVDPSSHAPPLPHSLPPITSSSAILCTDSPDPEQESLLKELQINPPGVIADQTADQTSSRIVESRVCFTVSSSIQNAPNNLSSVKTAVRAPTSTAVHTPIKTTVRAPTNTRLIGTHLSISLLKGTVLIQSFVCVDFRG